MTDVIFFNWVITMFKEIVKVVFPGASAMFLIFMGIKLSWQLLRGRGLK